jgi:hypothetical protein
MTGLTVFLIIFGIGIAIFILRLLGAWMLRIDEVIKHEREILAELKHLTDKLTKQNSDVLDKPIEKENTQDTPLHNVRHSR